MVLAKTENFNVLDNDQLVVVLVENRAIDNVPQILFITLCEIHHSFCVTLGRTMKTLSFRVLADALEKSAHCSRKLFLTCCGLLGGRLESLARAGTYIAIRNRKAARGRS